MVQIMKEKKPNKQTNKKNKNNDNIKKRNKEAGIAKFMLEKTKHKTTT